MNPIAYEHLPLETKKKMIHLAEDYGVLDEDAINQEINHVLSRRAKHGESLELCEVVQEVVIAANARIPESFREHLFQFIASEIH